MFESNKLYRPSDPALRVIAAEWTMARWRSQRSGPPFVKLNGGRVCYRGSDLNDWIDSQVVETGDRAPVAA